MGLICAGLIVAMLLCASPAAAHSPIQGIGGFYGGLLHPILVPAHALSLVALGLFIGHQRERWIVALMFAVALGAGLTAITFAVGETAAGDVLLANAALFGLLLATAWTPPRAIAWLLAAVGGAALALDSPPDAITIAEGNVILIGTGLGACIALAAVVAIGTQLERPWQRLGTRIVGSWIAASAILVLSLHFAAW